jgi:hypothetical protein
MGEFADLDLKQLFGPVNDSTNLDVTLEKHFSLGSADNTLHLKLTGGIFLEGQNGPNAFYSVGGRESFPYSLGTSFTLYGFVPDAISSPGAAIAEILWTPTLADIERGLGFVPLHLGRLVGGVRLQAAPIENYSGVVPWSVGLEVYQGLTVGNVFDLTARAAVYQGAPAQGGELQGLFTLTGSEL